eukprot:gene4175-5225_t
MIDIDQYLDIGFPLDQVKTVICMIISYPMAMIMKRLPNATMKHLMNIGLGIFYCTWSLGSYSWVHSFVSALIVYVMMSVLPRKSAPLAVFIFCMGYLSVSHWYRMYNDYMGWTLDYTGPQMILTLKLVSCAWNLYDGSRPSSELTEDQRQRSIQKLPNLLEFYGFVYFFPTFLAGPTIEIKDYLAYTSLSLFKNDPKLQGKIPSSGIASLKTLAKAFTSFAFVILSGKFPITYLYTTQFAMEPLIIQIVRVHIHVALTRFKYYFGWYMSEGSAILSGFSFNGFTKTGEMRWDRVTNVYPLKVEIASNIRDVSNNWNIGTSDWLKNYIYLRLTPPGAKPTFFATLATYTTSAFWHGFYPGYYLFFIFSTFLTELAKDFRRKVRPFFVKIGADNKEIDIQPQKLAYDIIGTICAEWWLSFFGISFLVLGIDYTLIAWKVFHFIPIAILLVTFILLRFVLPTPKSPSNRNKKTA